MTIGAQQFQILQSVVATVPIDVVKLKAQWPAAPFVEAAPLAAVLLHPKPHEPVLEVGAISPNPPLDEKLIEGKLRRAGDDRASLDGRGPARQTETELLRALPHREAGIVGGLDRGPVVPPRCSLVRGNAQATNVIGDGRLAEAEPPPDLRVAQALPM